MMRDKYSVVIMLADTKLNAKGKYDLLENKLIYAELA